jgi:amino acid adenylation domain-containing protein
MIASQTSKHQNQLWAWTASRPLAGSCVVRIQGQVNRDQLRSACDEVVRRYDILRSTFDCVPGTQDPCQVVNEKMQASWQEVALKVFRDAQARPDVKVGPVVCFTLGWGDSEEHRLCITVPSSNSDAQGLCNMVQEILESYVRSGNDKTATLLRGNISSQHFGAPVAAEKSSGEGEEYWAGHRFFSLPVPSFPLERRNGRSESEKNQTFPFRIEPTLAAKIVDAAKRSQVTESEFLLAGWASLLHRLTGEPEIPIIVVAAGRDLDETKKAIGLFASPLPVSVSISGEESFNGLLLKVRDRIAEGNQWLNHLSPEQVFPADAIDRAAALGFEFNRRVPDFVSPEVSFSIEDVRTEIYPFKAKLSFDWSDQGASARIWFDPLIISQLEARRISRYFLRLIEDVAQNPAAAISDLELLPIPERKEIVEAFNQTRFDYRLDQSFHEVFEEQVERTPDRVALVFDPLRLTFRELNNKANQLAHYLQSLGVKPGVRVGLFVRRSEDMIIGLLGILKAGGSYVALHPDLPKSRLAHQLAETETKLILTRERMLENLPEFEGKTVCMNEGSTDNAKIILQPTINLGHTSGPGDEIYVIFTSGSTGTPKGVSLRHENVVNYTQSICRQLKADEENSPGGLQFANVSTIAADLGNTPIYASLASGGCLHIINDDVVMDGALYAERCKTQPIDVLKITPSHFIALLDSGDPKLVLPRKYLVVGGEALRWELVRRIRALSSCKILNHYSPTECTIGCLTFWTDPNCPESSLARVAPLGHPIHNMNMYILDEKLRPLPIGVPGNLFIGGVGVSNGYVNRPDLTAERFLLDPLNPESGRRFYNSGDRTRFLPGGSIEFLGRQDDQIKVRGFRVELGEIETVLGKHPAVERAVVCANETETGDHVLAAFMIAPAKPRTEDIRSYLRGQLPDYMVPSHFIFVDSYPLNANAKVDRRALAASVKDVEEKTAPAQTALGNPIEQEIAAIWQEVLGLNEVGLDDNFFDLGGHSLLATQLIARIRTRLRVQVPLRAVFEAPTIAGLSEIIAHQQAASWEEDEVAKVLAEIENLPEDEVRKLLDKQN